MEQNKTIENIDDKLVETKDDKLRIIEEKIEELFVRVAYLESQIEDLRK